MEPNQEIQKKQLKGFVIWVVIVCLIITAVIIIINYRLSDLSHTIQDKKSQIQAIRNRENNINQLQDKYYQIVNDIQLVASSLPDEENVANFVKYLENLSNKNSVAIEILFDSKANTDVMKNKYLVFDLNVSGPGKNVSEFWQALEIGAYFINISNFNFSSTNGLNSDTKLSLKAKVYTNDPYQSNK